MTRPDPRPHLAAAAAALGDADQPNATFRALETAMHAAIGAKLFTILLKHSDGSSERFWSNRSEYAVGGRKPPNDTVWSRHVLAEQRCYRANDYEGVKAVFFDHELIRSLGCESVLNIPVVWRGETLGTINLLHQAGHYGESDETTGKLFAALAVPAFLLLTRS
jgi:GAF domain-containing protein